MVNLMIQVGCANCSRYLSSSDAGLGLHRIDIHRTNESFKEVKTNFELLRIYVFLNGNIRAWVLNLRACAPTVFLSESQKARLDPSIV